jgi:hypothetical protein
VIRICDFGFFELEKRLYCKNLLNTKGAKSTKEIQGHFAEHHVHSTMCRILNFYTKTATILRKQENMKTMQFLLMASMTILLAACSTTAPVTPSVEAPTSIPTILPTQAPTPSEIPTATAALPLAGQVTLVASTAKESGKAPDYTLQTQIPVLQSSTQGNDPRIKKFNDEVGALIQVAIDQFRKDLAGQPAIPIAGGSFFDVRYVLISPPGSKIISLQIKTEGMSDGAAHPYHITLSFNYDIETGEQISLNQLFLHGVNPLQTIADYCKSELAKRDIGFEGFAAGADPTPENYAVWSLSADGLVILFNEYQVTAYAAGPQSVTIPFEKLDKIIDPAGVLAGWKP